MAKIAGGLKIRRTGIISMIIKTETLKVDEILGECMILQKTRDQTWKVSNWA